MMKNIKSSARLREHIMAGYKDYKNKLNKATEAAWAKLEEDKKKELEARKTEYKCPICGHFPLMKSRPMSDGISVASGHGFSYGVNSGLDFSASTNIVKIDDNRWHEHKYLCENCGAKF